MIKASGFFGNIPVKTPSEFAEKTSFIDVGGDRGESGFRAMSAAIIENILIKPRIHQPLMNNLSERLSQYFDLPETQAYLSAPAQRLDKMLNSPSNLARVIADLAYTLRQIAVDELCTHPEYYRRAFVEKNEQISPLLMRQTNTYIEESVAALSNALDIPTTVLVVDGSKELPMRIHYGPHNSDAVYDEVIVRLQRYHYSPKLKQGARFESIVALSISAVPACLSSSQVDPDMSVILERIKKEDCRLVHVFEQIHHRLTMLVKTRSVTNNDLLDLYINEMKYSNPLSGCVKNVGIEHGNQRFFEDALHNSNRLVKVSNLKPESYNEQLTQELIHALARAISLGQLDENQFFLQVERKKDGPRGPAWT